MNLKDKIITYRARHNLSMKDFATLCNVSMQTIYSIENGTQDPSRLTVAKINLVLEGEDKND